MVELQVGIEHPKVEENGGGDLAGKVVRLLSLEFAITFHIDHHRPHFILFSVAQLGTYRFGFYTQGKTTAIAIVK